MTTITFRTIVEILGKPKEHVEESLQQYIKKLEEDERYTIIERRDAECEQQEETTFWSQFCELELQTKELDYITQFCFDYMPSLIEILNPQELTFDDATLSLFFSDLQARLHHVDMVAKQVQVERDVFQRNMSNLLRNYITLLLSKQSLSAEQMSKLTGVEQDKLEDFLDSLIDQKRIDLKQGTYFLKEDVPEKD